MAQLREFIVSRTEPSRQYVWLCPSKDSTYELLVYGVTGWQSITNTISSISTDNVYDSNGHPLSDILSEITEQIATLEDKPIAVTAEYPLFADVSVDSSGTTHITLSISDYVTKEEYDTTTNNLQSQIDELKEKNELLLEYIVQILDNIGSHKD